MSSKPEDLANIDLDKVVIQAAPKPRGIVGERIWGPYKIHAGTSVSDKYSGGPFGFGDPEDNTLRVVERDILIPGEMKRKANENECKELNKDFFKCAEEYGMFRMTWKCRPQGNLLKECVQKIMTDPQRVEEGTREYLAMRAEYRRTGKRKILKQK